MTDARAVNGAQWVSLLNIYQLLSTYEVMGAVGIDLRAIIKAAIFCKDVRKLGYREAELSRTPITTIQDDWNVNIEIGEIAEPTAYGRRWTQVVVLEKNVFDFLASTYGLPPPRVTWPDNDAETRIELIAPDPNQVQQIALLEAIQNAPTIDRPEPDASRFLFLDDAIMLIMTQLKIPEGPAVKTILDFIRNGHVRSYKRGVGSYINLAPCSWIGAHIDIEYFQAHGKSGLLFGGSRYHLQRFLLAKADFDHVVQPPLFRAAADLSAPEGPPDSGDDLMQRQRARALAPKQRGRKPVALTAVKERMLDALSAGHITPEQLANDTEESLVIVYGNGHKRDTCRKAREAALSHFAANSPPNK